MEGVRVLMIKKLHPNVSVETLEQTFGQYGPLQCCKVRTTRQQLHPAPARPPGAWPRSIHPPARALTGPPAGVHPQIWALRRLRIRGVQHP